MRVLVKCMNRLIRESRLFRESVDHKGLTQEKPTGSKWKGVLQKGGS